MKSMNDLVLHFLQDIYDAEKRGVRSMGKIGRSLENPELKQAIREHREQSQAQVHRLEQVFDAIGKRARGKTCAAMEGLTEEVEEAIEDADKGPVLDAALVACAQAIEHYEMARYGALIAWLRTMGLDEAVELLEQTLEEEKESDRRLSEIAERVTNRQVAESGAPDEESGEDEGADEAESEPAAEEIPARSPRRRGSPKAAASGRKTAEKPARGVAAKKPATRRGSSRK